MIADLVFGLLGKALGLGGGILEKKQRLREIEIEAQAKIAVAQAEAEIARLSKMAEADINWDLESARQMQHSWKDEWMTFLLSGPMIVAFVPGGQEIVAEGFAAIASVPDWYKVSFLTAVAASFGMRALVNKFGFGKTS